MYAWHLHETLEALKLRNLIHCLQRIVVMNVAPVEGKISFLPDSATEFKLVAENNPAHKIKQSSIYQLIRSGETAAINFINGDSFGNEKLVRSENKQTHLIPLLSSHVLNI